MLKMIKLVQNENMKTFWRISTWIMVGLLIVLIIASALITKFVVPGSSANADWKGQLTQQNENLSKTASQPGMTKIVQDSTMKQIKINEYRIENDIPPVDSKSLWGFVISSKGLISFISLFVIIIGAGAVANEFSSGTIKLLLIRPVKRWKILLSKYISTLLYALVMIVQLFIVSFIAGGIFFGFEGISQPYLVYSNGQVHETSIVLQTFLQYGLSCIDMLMMVTLAFMISTVFRNNALAIGIAVFLMFSGSILVTIFSKYSWVKYILFANTDLSMYFDGVPYVEGMTMAFSLIILAVYFAVFNLISWTTFIKRDVAA